MNPTKNRGIKVLIIKIRALMQNNAIYFPHEGPVVMLCSNTGVSVHFKHGGIFH
jgi:hypothetical protein